MLKIKYVGWPRKGSLGRLLGSSQLVSVVNKHG